MKQAQLLAKPVKANDLNAAHFAVLGFCGKLKQWLDTEGKRLAQGGQAAAAPLARIQALYEDFDGQIREVNIREDVTYEQRIRFGDLFVFISE